MSECVAGEGGPESGYTDIDGFPVTQLSNENYTYEYCFANGSAAMESDIQRGTELTILENSDKVNCKVIISTRKEEGTIESVWNEAGVNRCRINGNDYKLSSKVRVSNGESGIFYINAMGRIIGKETDVKSRVRYAYLLDAGIIEGPFGNTLKIMYASSDGDTKISNVAADLFLYRDDCSLLNSISDGDFGLYQIESGYINAVSKMLFKYSQNSADEINRIYLPTDSGESDDLLKLERTYEDEIYTSGKLGDTNIKSDTIFFCVKLNHEFESVTTANEVFVDDHIYSVDVYDSDAEGSPSVIVGYNAFGYFNIRDNIFLISKVTVTKNKDGITVNRYYGYKNGDYVSIDESPDGVTVTDSLGYDIS